MKVTDEEIQKLVVQLKECSVQIAITTEKREAALATASKFVHELDQLRSKHLATAQKLRELEMHKSGMYMWENIGDGG
jgi:D-arabinose 5-phosphate isomerase GutQ